MATPSITNSGAQAFVTASTSWSKTYNNSATGVNRALLVIVVPDASNSNPTDVTYNSVSMTQILDFAGLGVSGMTYWFLADAATGNNDIVATWGSSTAGQYHFMSLQDVKQTSPVNTSGQAGAGTGTSQSKQITTTVDNCLIVSLMDVFQATGISNSQTTIASTNTTNYYTQSSYSTLATAGNVTHSFSWTGGSLANDETVVALEPAPANNSGFFAVVK